MWNNCQLVGFHPVSRSKGNIGRRHASSAHERDVGQPAPELGEDSPIGLPAAALPARFACRQSPSDMMSFIRKSSDVVFWSEGGPGDCEVGHATNADPNGLRVRWVVPGPVIVPT